MANGADFSRDLTASCNSQAGLEGRAFDNLQTDAWMCTYASMKSATTFGTPAYICCLYILHGPVHNR